MNQKVEKLMEVKPEIIVVDEAGRSPLFTERVQP